MSYLTNAKNALKAFNEVYYNKFNSFIWLMFWDTAEIVEMIEDACEKLDSSNQDQLKNVLDKALSKNQEDWSNNPFYDDILWMCLAFIRASKILNDDTYFNIAKRNFDYVTEHGVNPDGLIEWKEGTHQSCTISSTTYVVCASLIGKTLEDNTYLEKGKTVLDKVMTSLYNPDNGHVYDHINEDGSIEYFEHVSNAGMFIRACSEVYDYTQDEKYVAELDKAASYIIAKKYNSGTMCEHESGDGAGFKAILARQLRYIADRHNLPDYVEWMRCSADSAWNNRNKYDLMQNDFCTKTADHKLYRAFDCQSAVTLLINCVE